MNHSSRPRGAGRQSRVATAADLQRALDRVGDGAATPAAQARSHPPQAPPFLAGLPRTGDTYEPQQPITQRLASIIEANFYTGNFEAAIDRVSGRRVPELQRIKTLSQFYFYVDALVRWIPEIRVWDYDGETMHERTVYLRITQFYFYFNQPELEMLQSPIAAGQTNLSPISGWLRDFAVEWGSFLDTPESAEYLESFKYAPEYAWQDFEHPPEGYGTFNEYFSRTFRDIDLLRPVASKDDDRVIAFPAESTFVGQWAVSTPVGDPLPAAPSIG